MSSGRFTAVVHGTWETGSSVPVLPLAGAVIVAVVLSWLATLLWLLAAVLGVLLTLAFGGLVVIRRYNRRETSRFIGRMGALGEHAPQPAVTAVQASVIHYHTHLHIEPGTDAEALIRQALPHRDAITIITEED